jgi:RNA polymerase sigma factor (sigma-70 family)
MTPYETFQVEQEMDALVVKSQNGDMNAFEDLVAHHYDYGQRICSSRFRTLTSDDILSIAFIKVWRNIRRLNDPRKFRSWFRTILINSAMDMLREEQANVFGYSESNISSGEQDSSIEAIMSLRSLSHFRNEEYQTELRELVQEQISKLKEPERSILVGFYLDGMSISELAAHHQMTEQNIKVKSHRAKKSLKKMIHSNALCFV